MDNLGLLQYVGLGKHSLRIGLSPRPLLEQLGQQTQREPILSSQAFPALGAVPVLLLSFGLGVKTQAFHLFHYQSPHLPPGSLHFLRDSTS